MPTRARWGIASAAALTGVLANRELVNRETKPAEPDGGRVFDLPEGDLHVVEEGSGGGPALLLLHGFAGSLHWFDRLTPLLAPDHRIIRLDLLGHGGSSKPRGGYEVENQARLAGLVLDRIAIGPVTVVGHSFGAAVGLALAEQRRERVAAIAIVDEGPDNSFGGWPFLARLGLLPVVGELAHRVTPDGMVRDGYADAFAKGFDLGEGFTDPDQVVRDYRRMTFGSYKQSARAEDAYLEAERLDSRLRRLDLPALAVFGEHDRFFRAGESARAFEAVPGTRVEILPAVGHSPAVEAPERVAELVRELAAAVASPVAAA